MVGDDGFGGVAELAGYFLAHAVCRIEHGDTLVPLIGHERVVTDQGERAFALLRFEAPDENEALRNAQQWLETNEHDLARAVLIHDGLVTWDGIRRDARGFAIHRPKLFAAVNLPEALEPIIRALYRGVDAHEQGSKSWSRHLDQSI